MIGKFAFFITGLGLIPVCAVSTRMFMFLIRSVQPADGTVAVLSAPFLAFSGGMAAWLLISLTLSGQTRAYVLAHELTHAMWGLLMGAKVSRIQVKKNSGSVTLSKTNFLIVLAPYFFPFYAVLIIVAYYVAGMFVAVENYETVWLALVGLTWGFHLTFTVSALGQKQSDVRQYGYVFSYALVLTLNVLVMAFWLTLTTSATLNDAAGFVREDALRVADGLSQGARWAVNTMSAKPWSVR